ncbi:MAG TPA: hypothetical protein VGV64_07310 [Thermoplasmata archaeon]|nr:hypothetical protein [Thermoplasmata archaeon]
MSSANLAGVALSADGTGMIVWQRGGARNVLMATHFLPNGRGDGGTNWQVPQMVSNSPNDMGYTVHGAVAMDATGDAMAVYYTFAEIHGYAVYAALYRSGVGWQTPVAVDQPYDYSYSPVVAMNGAGDAFAVWQVWNGNHYAMFANRYLPTSGWGTAQAIESSLNNTYSPEIAVDGSGNAIATWYEYDGSTDHVYAARFSTSTGWLAPLMLQTSTNYAVYPTVALDAAGNGVVAWLEYSGGYHVWAKLYDHTAGWAVAARIEASTYSATTQPPDAAASNGNLSVVWSMYDSTGTSNVFLNRYVAGTGWIGELDVDGTTSVADSPRVAMDPSGNVTVVFSVRPTGTTPANLVYDETVRYDHVANAYTVSQLDYSRVGIGSPLVAIDGNGGALAVWNYNDNTDPTAPARNGILTNHYTKGSGWQPFYQAQVAEWDEQISPSWLQLETNLAGDAIYSFTQNDGPISHGYATLYRPGGGWGPVTRIENMNASGPAEEWSAIDGSGNAIVLFKASDGTQYNVYATYYAVGTGWGAPQRLDSAVGSSKYWLRIAMDERGDGVAAWQEYNGSNWNAYSAYFSGSSHTWTATVEVQSRFTYLSSVVVGIDGNGNAMAAYNAYNGSGYSNYASAYQPGVGWGLPVQIAQGPSAPGTPYALAMSSSGAFAASWTDWDGTRYVAAANVYSPTSGWGTETRFISGPGDEGAATPSVDAAGDALFAYNVWDGSQFDAYAVVKPAVGAWGAPVKLSSGSGDATEIATALDGHGDGFAVWAQYNGYGHDLLARRYVASQGWISQVIVNLPAPATPATDTGSPNLGLDGHGNAVLGWNEWENGALLPYATTYVVGNGLPTLILASPSDGTVTNDPTVTVSGTTDPGVSLTIDGTPVNVGANGSFSQSFVIPAGSHTFVLIAKNPAGLSSGATASIVVDGPLLTLSSPIEGYTNRSAVVVTGTTEPWASITVDGSAVIVGSTGSFTTTLQLTEGAHSIVVVATDAAGDRATEAVGVTVDTTPPTLSITSPSPSASVSTPVVAVIGVAEAGSTVWVDGVPVTLGSGGSFSSNVALTPGSNTITVTATDPAGNVATRSLVVTFTDPITAANAKIGTLTALVAALAVLVAVALALGAYLAIRGRKSPPPPRENAPTAPSEARPPP